MSCHQLKHIIKLQLADDVIDDFDVRYYQAITVVSIRSPQDVIEVWNDVKKGVKVILWSDGLKESKPTATNSRKRSKKKVDSDSDSDEDISGRSTSKKKMSDKDEQLEKIVNELTLTAVYSHAISNLGRNGDWWALFKQNRGTK